MTPLELFLMLPVLASPLAMEYNIKPGKNMLFMTLCAGATNPAKCIPQHFSAYSILKTFTADCSDTIMKGECRATVVFSAKELTLGIFFRGPFKIADFKSSAATTISAQTLVDFNGLGKVGDQFLITFNRLWNVEGLGTYVKELWEQYCDLTLMEFAARMDESAYHRYRINWLTDNVPQYPPTTCDVYSKPKRGSGTDCWFHCCFAINYKQWALGGLVNEVELCDLPEDPTCNTGTNSKDHTSYFSTSQGDYDGLTCGLLKKFTVA